MTTHKPFPAYRSTELPWLPQIPEHWKIERAKFVFKPIDERSTEGAEQLLSVSEHHGVIPRSQANVTMFQAESYEGFKLCKPRDLVINSLWAWSKGLGFSEYSGIISTAYSVFRLRQPEQHNHRFLHYLLRTNMYVGQYIIRSKGVWISRLQLSDWNFLNIPIVLPPAAEQTAIANFLDQKLAEIDGLVTRKKKLIELLEERKRKEVSRLLSEGVWEEKRLKYVSKILRGRFSHRPRNDEALYNGQYPFIQTGEVSNSDKYITGFKQTLNDLGYAVSTEFPAGTICMTIAANIGDVAILQFNACFPDSIVGFKPLDTIYAEYLYYSLKNLRQKFFSVATLNTQLNLNVERISSFKIKVPPISVQEEKVKFIVDIHSTIDQVISDAEREIALLQEYRTTLIVETVTGKREVRAEGKVYPLHPAPVLQLAAEPETLYDV